MYVLNLLRKKFNDHFTRFQETLKDVPTDNLKEKWYGVLFTNNCLPELIGHLRDISYLSKFSLLGFSVEVTNEIKSNLT